jgi:hypothetical protein
VTKLAGKVGRLWDLERIIVDAVSGMDPDDAIGTVKVHYSDGSARWLVDVIKEANDLRFDLERGIETSRAGEG